jgi:hypothetical protein
VVAGHRQHIADASTLKLGPQARVGAVDLVAGYPCRWDAGIQGTAEHGLGQGRLGGEPNLVGDARGLQAFRILDPASGHIQLPVDHGVPSIGGVQEVDGDLGVLDAAGGAGVLALHPNRLQALLEVAGLVDDQHRLGIAQVLDHISAHVVADPVVVPYRPTEQVLHPIGAGVPGVLSDRPAVLSWQIGQQPEHERPGPLAWLHPAEPPRDPAQQLLQARLPAGRVYL